MATTYTEHLQIPKHSPTDPFNIALINEGFDKTEAGILAAYRGMAAHSLLRNGYFPEAYVINQRGKTAYTGSGNSIDGWRAYHADTTHTITANGLAVGTNGGANPNLYQVLDANLIDTSKTYTAACCDSDGNIYVKTMKPTTAVYNPVCMYVSGNNILFRILGEKTWRWALLLKGEYTLKDLPTVMPNDNELLICQQYTIALGGVYRYRSTQIAGSIIDFNINLPIKMKARPTFPASALTVLTIDGTAQNGFTFSIVGENATGFTIRATKSGHGLTDALLNIAAGTIFTCEP